MIQTDIDISTKVRYHGQTGVLIYNRCRQGNEVVVIELDSTDFSHRVKQVNVNDLEVKNGGEKWISVLELGKR